MTAPKKSILSKYDKELHAREGTNMAFCTPGEYVARILDAYYGETKNGKTIFKLELGIVFTQPKSQDSNVAGSKCVILYSLRPEPKLSGIFISNVAATMKQLTGISSDEVDADTLDAWGSNVHNTLPGMIIKVEASQYITQAGKAVTRYNLSPYAGGAEAFADLVNTLASEAPLSFTNVFPNGEEEAQAVIQALADAESE